MTIEYEKLVVLMEASVAKFDKDIQNIAGVVDTQMRNIETRTGQMSANVEREFTGLGRRVLDAAGLGSVGTKIAEIAALAGGGLTIGIAAAATAIDLFVEHTDLGTKAADAFKTGLQELAEQAAKPMFPGAKNTLGVRPDQTPTESKLQRDMPLPLPYMEAGAARGKAANDALVQFHKDADAAEESADAAAGVRRGAAIDAALAKEKDFHAEMQAVLDAADQHEGEALGAFLDKRQSLIDDADQKLGEARGKALEAGVQNTDKFTAEELDALTQFHKDADQSWNDYYEGQANAAQDHADRIKEIADRTNDQMVRGLADSMASFGDTMDAAGGKFGKAVEQMVLDLAKLALKLEVTKELESVLGSAKSGGTGVGLFSSIGKFLGFASGGDPPVGVPSLVGEDGPELFVPKVAGTIYPAGAARSSGSGGNMQLHVHVSGARGNAEIRDMVAVGVQQGIAGYDKVLPSRVWRINGDPYGR